MFQMVILVCSFNMSPTDCQIDNALDVIRGPEVSNAAMCGFHGQAYMAQTALVGRGSGEYVKLGCNTLGGRRRGFVRPRLA